MTKYTPYEILFGTKFNLPGQLKQTTASVCNYDDIVYDVKQKLQTCHEVARGNIRNSKQRSVARQACKITMPVYNKGDKVLLRN